MYVFMHKQARASSEGVRFVQKRTKQGKDYIYINTAGCLYNMSSTTTTASTMGTPISDRVTPLAASQDQMLSHEPRHRRTSIIRVLVVCGAWQVARWCNHGET